MPDFTQDTRQIAVTTPLGKDKLLLEGFTGTEQLSGLFAFDLEMLALSTTTVGFDQILGQSATIAMTLAGGEKRYFNGVVRALTQGRHIAVATGTDTLVRYRAELVPALWLLTKKVQSRIFQHLSVPDILKKVLTGVSTLKVKYSLRGTYEPRDYCTQYRESDFAFASRLMEEEGMYYYFEHTASDHTMVVADSYQSHPDVPGETTVVYDEVGGDVATEDRVHAWEKRQELRSGKVTLWDYSFEMWDKHLEATEPTLATAKLGTVSHSLKVGGNDQFEIYDFPGGYAQRFDGVDKGGSPQAAELQKIFTDNKRTTGIRMQREALPGLTAFGQGEARQFIAGSKFTLDRHSNANGSYVLTSVKHQGSLKGAYTSGGVPSFDYSNEFTCIPHDFPFRPAAETPRPVVQGTQTAVVVGPANQEIFTDKYGRVKVQFFWDREGKKDADSSCWIRVGTPIAGKGWGMVHLPRIGQEVIIAFLEGDPDQPIIVGSVYNNENMPLYTLPDNMTRSYYQSRSTLKGEAANFNEIRFEDKKGSEEVYFHAEKDFNRVVENNDTLKVGSDKADDGSQTIEIWKDRTETIKTGNETLTIEKGNRTETIKEGDEKVTLEKGSRTHAIKTDDTLTVEGKQTITVTGDRAIEVKSGNYTMKVSAGKIEVEAAQSIELKVGGNTIKIDTSSITLTVGGTSIKLEAAGIKEAGPEIKLDGSAKVAIAAPAVSIAAPALTIDNPNLKVG